MDDLSQMNIMTRYAKNHHHSRLHRTDRACSQSHCLQLPPMSPSKCKSSQHIPGPAVICARIYELRSPFSSLVRIVEVASGHEKMKIDALVKPLLRKCPKKLFTGQMALRILAVYSATLILTRRSILVGSHSKSNLPSKFSRVRSHCFCVLRERLSRT